MDDKIIESIQIPALALPPKQFWQAEKTEIAAGNNLDSTTKKMPPARGYVTARLFLFC